MVGDRSFWFAAVVGGMWCRVPARLAGSCFGAGIGIGRLGRSVGCV